MKIGSLFSGAGGLDMAVAEVFGGEVAWHSEIDKAASKVLAYRWPDVPNLGSVTEIDWASVEPVDVLCGGFPCQDVSAAGKRAGIQDGTRSGLWAIFADAIDALRPQYVIIENVRGLLSATAHRAVESDDPVVGNEPSGPILRAAGAVLADLADLGYDAVWATVSAASVGAPHRRERVFIVATDAECSRQQRLSDDARGRQSDIAGSGGWHEPEGSGTASGCGPQSVGTAANAPRNGRDERRPEPAGQQRGFDAAVSGDAAGRVELLPTPRSSRGGSTTETTYAFGGVRSDDNRTQGEVLLPTPNAQDGNGGKAPRGGRDTHNTGTKRQVPLTDLPDLLPTPTSRDMKGRNQRDDETCLTGALLPTPNASDGSGGGQHPDKKEGHSRQLIDYVLLSTPSASDGAGGKTSRSGARIDEPLLGGQVREMATAWGKYEAAIRRWEQVAGPAPAPTEPNRNNKLRLNPAFSEWMMGWPAGWVTDTNIGISRNDQLRIVGNGVCSQQAVAALRYLLAVTT